MLPFQTPASPATQGSVSTSSRLSAIEKWRDAQGWRRDSPFPRQHSQAKLEAKIALIDELAALGSLVDGTDIELADLLAPDFDVPRQTDVWKQLVSVGDDLVFEACATVAKIHVLARTAYGHQFSALMTIGEIAAEVSRLNSYLDSGF